MSLGQNIFYYRTSLNQSQAELADMLDVSRQSVSKWENDSAVPDLDKLIKMSNVFHVSLDTLVSWNPQAPSLPPVETPAVSTVPPTPGTMTVVMPSVRSVIGCIMLVFGMTFFLLSIFWGNHLYFGEAFGEFASIVILLLSVAILGFDHFNILSICSIIYFIYCTIGLGILHIKSIWNDLFIFCAGTIILIWFILLGLKETKGIVFKPISLDGDPSASSNKDKPSESESSHDDSLESAQEKG